MTAIRVPLTGFEAYIDEDQPAIYLTAGQGNIEGVQEAFLTFFDPETDDEETHIGWVSVERLRDALNALPITPTRRINS